MIEPQAIRLLLLAICASLLFVLSGEANARSMYCTRHPEACQAMREKAAERDRQYLQWWNSLSTEERIAEKARQAAASAEAKRVADEAERELWLAIAALGGVAIIVGGGLGWILASVSRSR